MLFELQQLYPSYTKYDISHHLFGVILFAELTPQKDPRLDYGSWLLWIESPAVSFVCLIYFSRALNST